MHSGENGEISLHARHHASACNLSLHHAVCCSHRVQRLFCHAYLLPLCQLLSLCAASLSQALKRFGSQHLSLAELLRGLGARSYHDSQQTVDSSH
jgi:hypothetical protein